MKLTSSFFVGVAFTLAATLMTHGLMGTANAQTPEKPREYKVVTVEAGFNLSPSAYLEKMKKGQEAALNKLSAEGWRLAHVATATEGGHFVLYMER